MYWVAKYTVGFSLVASAVFGEELQQASPSMHHLSQALVGIENSLADGERAVLTEHVRALRAQSGNLDELEPQKNEELVRIFDQYRADIGHLAAELEIATAEDNRAEIPRIVEKIRHTCVYCHVKFATDKESLYPNTGNIVTGQVRVFKEEGVERLDRSNLLVFLDRVPGFFPPSGALPALSQRGQRFAPRVLPVVKGTKVEFPNDDRVFHNVFSLSRPRPFDLDAYPPGETRSMRFDETGWIKVYCNIHAEMNAHILVLDNPFFSLTDQAGLFVIPGVPDGRYPLRIWHELGGEVRRSVEVEGGGLHYLDLEIWEDRKILRHKNKFGKSYPEKY